MLGFFFPLSKFSALFNKGAALGFSRHFCWWWLQGSAGRAREGAKCSERQLKGDVSFLLKSGSVLMHKDQLQFQNSCTGLCESQQAGCEVKAQHGPGQGGARGAFVHLAFFLFSHKDQIPSFHSKLITGQTKLGNHSKVCFTLMKPWQMRIKILSTSQVCAPASILPCR